VRITAFPEAGLGGALGAEGQDEPSANPAETFREVLQYVYREYVDEVKDPAKLGQGAVRTMLSSLDDPKTRFMDPDQRKQFMAQMNGEFNGIGAVLTVVKQKKGEVDQRRLAVVSPVPGGPADKAGLRAGDIITEIDESWIIAYDPRIDLDKMQVKSGDDKEYRKAFKAAGERLKNGTTLPKALEQLTQGSGKALKLTVERPGAPTPLKLDVTTATVALEPAEYKELDATTGYLRVTQFNEKATSLVQTALDSSKGKALVLDLRGNAGGPVVGKDSGSMGTALALLARLTPGGDVATLIRPGNKQEKVTVQPAGGAKRKLVVVVNAGTSNLAEMVAASLKEKAGASIVGSATFGDAVYQKLVELQGGSAMTVTAGKLQTAAGKDLSKGIQPDVPVQGGGPQAGDPVVQRAISVLKA
jgi:carboxyl-terminal processing protease